MEGVTRKLTGLTLRTNSNGDIFVVLHMPSLLQLPTNKNGSIRGVAIKRLQEVFSNDKVYTHHLPFVYNNDDLPANLLTSWIEREKKALTRNQDNTNQTAHQSFTVSEQDIFDDNEVDKW